MILPSSLNVHGLNWLGECKDISRPSRHATVELWNLYEQQMKTHENYRNRLVFSFLVYSRICDPQQNKVYEEFVIYVNYHAILLYFWSENQKKC